MVDGSSWRARTGIRLRFVVVLLVVTAVISTGFIVAALAIVDELEVELLDRRLDNELLEFVAAYEYDPDMPLLTWGGLERYLAEGGDLSNIPPALRDMEAGEVRELTVRGRDVIASRANVGADALFVTIDLAPVQKLERQVRGRMTLIFLFALTLAVVVALVLATAVTRPVSALARSVAALNPPYRMRGLFHRSNGREVQAIAEAFDQFLDRLDAFVAREQAFTEDASHELRTPLSIIISAAQLLESDAGLPDSAQEKIRRIARAAVQMQSVIEALLLLSREEAPQPHHRSAVEQIVEDSAELVAPQAEARGIDIVFETLEPTAVAAAEGITRCVVRNLLANAIAHSRGGVIHVSLRGAVLRVEDHGVGIEPQVLDHVFERRVRGSQSTGQGIGLYLVKRICDRLGWQVTARSQVGEGACFEVNFGVGGSDYE